MAKRAKGDCARKKRGRGDNAIRLHDLTSGVRSGREFRRLLCELRVRGIAFLEIETPSSAYFARGQTLKRANRTPSLLFALGWGIGQLVRPIQWFQNSRSLYGDRALALDTLDAEWQE